MQSLILLLGGLGIGSLLTIIAQYYLNRKQQLQTQLYEDKRNAYINLLGSLHSAAVEPSDKNSKEFALWQTHCQLFGSIDVAKYAQNMVDTNDGPRELRDIAFKSLVEAMRNDLRII